MQLNCNTKKTAHTHPYTTATRPMCDCCCIGGNPAVNGQEHFDRSRVNTEAEHNENKQFLIHNCLPTS